MKISHSIVYCSNSYKILLILQLMLNENNRIRGKIPELFEPLMEPHLERIDEMLSPGLSILRWTSLNIRAFTESVHESLKKLELLIDRATDVLEVWIEEELRVIQSTKLCELPDNEPWTVEEFLQKTEVSSVTCTIRFDI